MGDSAERMRRKRERDERAVKLAEFGWEEGTRPTDQQREKIRAAVEAGEIEVPADGFDTGPWVGGESLRWFPGGVAEPDHAEGRAIRQRRREAADAAGVAIGWVDADGNVDPKAPKLPKAA